ncbi:hypothetical protein [Brevifollis gellanilyticus]|nr:hypothetical protein [Brevifollis gellanilyticus]
MAAFSVVLAAGSVVFFVAGFFVGSLNTHRPDEGARDTLAFILCRVVSQLLAFGAWAAGFAAVLQRSPFQAWKAVVVMLLILIFLIMLFYSASKGTAAFH